MPALSTTMRIKVSQDFAFAPGARYEHEGPNSGERFRREILAPAVRRAIDTKQKLEIDLDGVAGYGRSFLEESFGGLIREDHLAYESILDTIIIVSKEQPSLRTRVYQHLLKAYENEAKSVADT